MEIVLLILVFVGYASVNDGTEENPTVASHEQFKNYAPDKSLGSFVIYSDKGYVISNKALVPTKKTKLVGSLELDSQPSVAHKNSAKLLGQVKIASKQTSHDKGLIESYKVFFDNDKYDLKNDSIVTITKAIKRASSSHEKVVYVRGYATNTGALNHNIQLATNRANAVKELIESLSSLKAEVLNPLSAKQTIKTERFAVIILGE